MSAEDLEFTATEPLRCIGFGNCGSVWGTLRSTGRDDFSSTPLVIKREDACTGRDIKNEVAVQVQVNAESITRTLTPRCLTFMDGTDPKWNQVLPLLPENFSECRVMVSEKIRPVSSLAQRTLIEIYAPKQNGEPASIAHFGGDKQHCLVRIYLGRRRNTAASSEGHRQRKRFFSLRNFPLHADRAEELNLPCKDYALAMAEAMAILHWKLKSDGSDVEFVLGSPSRDEQPAIAATAPLDQHALWMLDFDCCRPISMDDSGVEKIARAFWRNDPYFPRPGSTVESDQELWDVFATEYCRIGREIVRDNHDDGEDVERLCHLVDRVIVRIAETRGEYSSRSYISDQ